MARLSQKESGAYYTPENIVESLVKWAAIDKSDRLLDPSCGDGRFVQGHRNSVGVEQDQEAVKLAVSRAPWAVVHCSDFFEWAESTEERFECAAGNPPFIRYHTFKGDVRARALALCSRLGATFSGLTSSWAPFLVAAASVLKLGGRMAFVVPAEIGHAPYSSPLLEYLVSNFSVVHVVAVRRKLFPALSEDCWLLYASGFGDQTDSIRFTPLDVFNFMAAPPRSYIEVAVDNWRNKWNSRLRPFLISEEAREAYLGVLSRGDTLRLGDVASVGIGYVTGANNFFHLRPSEAKRLGIPKPFLHPSVRNGRALSSGSVSQAVVDKWLNDDEKFLLLKIPKKAELPESVRSYLETEDAKAAKLGYKCRNRNPWYSVPDVQIPDFFLSYMSGREPSLVANQADCACTNSVHSVRVFKKEEFRRVLVAWDSSFAKLSCEIEGHPLGGGMLKLEPGEAKRLVLPSLTAIGQLEDSSVLDALNTMRTWRHYAD